MIKNNRPMVLASGTFSKSQLFTMADAEILAARAKLAQKMGGAAVSSRKRDKPMLHRDARGVFMRLTYFFDFTDNGLLFCSASSVERAL